MAEQLTERELKLAFARAWLKAPKNPFEAARTVFGLNTGAALHAATNWTTDAEVLAECARLKEDEGAKSFLTSKEELARKILEAVEDPPLETQGGWQARIPIEDKLKAFKLYAEVMGYIEKPQAVINNNPVTNNRVMVVKDSGSDEDWEKKAARQQKELIERNATRH